MATRQPTVSSHSARFLCRAAADAGADPERLLEEVGLPETVLSVEEQPVPYEQAKALWAAARRHTDDPLFGLHAALRLRPDAFGAMGYAVRSCKDSWDAMERMIHYTNAYYEDLDFRLDVEGATGCFAHGFESEPSEATDQAADFISAAFVVLSREFVGIDWTPLAMHLQREAPADTSEHAALFRAPLRFGAPRNEVHFEAKLLGMPLLGANPSLQKMLDQYVDDILARFPHASAFATQVRRTVALGLQRAEVSVEATARALGVSVRTLQRRLQQEQTSHREVLDSARHALACRYLHERDLSVDQVAYLLGFSESSAFHRAFRRWTRSTPASFRARLASGTLDP